MSAIVKKAGLSFLDAAVLVLREERRALGSFEIAQLALQRSLVNTSGRTPQNTFSSIITQSIKKDPRSPFICISKNSFTLKEFSDGLSQPDAEYFDESPEPPRTRKSARTTVSSVHEPSQRPKQTPALRARATRSSHHHATSEESHLSSSTATTTNNKRARQQSPDDHTILHIHPPSSPSSWEAPSALSDSGSRRSSMSDSEATSPDRQPHHWLEETIDAEDVSHSQPLKRQRVGGEEESRHSPSELTADTLFAHHQGHHNAEGESDQEESGLVEQDAAALLIAFLTRAPDSIQAEETTRTTPVVEPHIFIGRHQNHTTQVAPRPAALPSIHQALSRCAEIEVSTQSPTLAPFAPSSHHHHPSMHFKKALLRGNAHGL